MHSKVISDEPAYKFRGLMIDTARHFLSVPTILTVLEGMSVEKLNVLHWHAADDQSFPLESVALPRLAAAGPYGPGLGYSAEFPALTFTRLRALHCDDVRYTTENNSLVIAYARSRGIRVILEIDTPGHSQVGCTLAGPACCRQRRTITLVVLHDSSRGLKLSGATGRAVCLP